MTDTMVLNNVSLKGAEFINGVKMKAAETVEANIIRLRKASLERLNKKKKALLNQEFFVDSQGNISQANKKVILKKTQSIARLEAFIKFISREDLPKNWVADRAIKLRDRMYQCLSYNSLCAYTCVGEEKMDKVFSFDSVPDLDSPVVGSDRDQEVSFVMGDQSAEKDAVYESSSDDGVKEADVQLEHGSLEDSASGVNIGFSGDVPVVDNPIGVEVAKIDDTQSVVDGKSSGGVQVPPLVNAADAIVAQPPKVGVVRDDIQVVPDRTGAPREKNTDKAFDMTGYLSDVSSKLTRYSALMKSKDEELAAKLDAVSTSEKLKKSKEAACQEAAGVFASVQKQVDALFAKCQESIDMVDQQIVAAEEQVQENEKIAAAYVEESQKYRDGVQQLGETVSNIVSGGVRK